MKLWIRLALVIAACASAGYSQQNADVHVLHVQGSVYMLVTPDGNIGVQISSDGVLLVDTGSTRMTDQILAAVRQLAKPLTNKPLRFIVNTDFHPDHIGGNEKAAALSGINTRMVKFLNYILSGVLSAVTGILFVARFQSAQADAGTRSVTNMCVAT